jgi:hypothetical protein
MLIVTGAPRAHDVFGMKWGEVQFTQWHVPAKRVKGRTDHIIPLPEEAMAILRKIMPDNPSPTDCVFAGSAAGGRINHQAMRLLLRALGLPYYDVHGVRFLRGVAYTGDFEVPALSVVVENAAAAQRHGGNRGKSPAGVNCGSQRGSRCLAGRRDIICGLSTTFYTAVQLDSAVKAIKCLGANP